jgi:hypothetical protein
MYLAPFSLFIALLLLTKVTSYYIVDLLAQIYNFYRFCCLNYTGEKEKLQIKGIMVLNVTLPIKLPLLVIFIILLGLQITVQYPFHFNLKDSC